MPVHGIDNGNNKHDVYTTEELLSILQQAINSGSLQGIDPTQTPIVAAVRESHNNSDVTFWSGTEAEFNELVGVTSELVGARIGSDGKLYILTGDTTLSDTVEAARQAALEATEGMKREVISVTLPASGWSNTAPYTQTVAVPGMTDDKDFLAPYVVPTGNESDDLAAQVALSCISGGTTDTDSVTFYCYDDKPTTDITVYMVDKGTKLESSYPIASSTNIGMVKVGDGLSVDNAGELSVSAFEVATYSFDSVASMVDYNLAEGDMAITAGYYSANDGGAATYKIIDSEITADGGSIIALDNGLKAQLIAQNGTVSVKQFGAIDSNSVDQYQFISMAVAYCFNNGIRKLELNGEYFVDNSISFSNKSDLTISNGTIYVHETAEKLAANFKVFSFSGCSNINIEKIKIIELEPVTRARYLYQGGIYFYACHECRVKDCYLENIHNGIILQGNSYNCVVENNNIIVNYHSNQFAESAILNYASHDNVIRNNSITGEYYDGSLSIYGAGCKNVLVDGNVIKGVFDENILWLPEGVCIDAGCDSTIVTNNTIMGQWYGIDNKNDSINTLICDNTIYACKVAIADRPGEENKQTFNCQIKNNQIIFEKAWDTSVIAQALFANTYYFVGIYANEKLSGDIKNNKITMYKSIDDKAVCAIYCASASSSSSNVYQSQFDVQGNMIEFSTGFGANTANAGDDSSAIHFNHVLKGNIIGNSLKVDVTSRVYNFLCLQGDNSFIYVTSNSFLATSTSNHYFVKLRDSATIVNSEITGNKLKHTKPVFYLENITNVVEMPKYAIRAHQISTHNFTANEWLKVATMSVPYAGGIYHIKLQSSKSQSGNKYLFAEFILSIGTDSVTATEINKVNNGLDVQFVAGASAKTCDIQIKATSNLNSFAELFISEIMGDQIVTLSE